MSFLGHFGPFLPFFLANKNFSEKLDSITFLIRILLIHAKKSEKTNESIPRKLRYRWTDRQS